MEPLRVVIAGGGVAGLEAMLALRELAGDRVDIELLSPSDEFVYRPMLVAEPFGSGRVLRLSLDRLVRDAGARHRQDALDEVDVAAREVITTGGERVSYEALIIALGARPVESVPGALTFSGESERRRFGEILSALGRRGMRRIAFVVPREATWSIAAYELALLTAAERDARKLSGVEIDLVTHEAQPLDLFGVPAAQLVSARLAEAGVQLRTSSVAEAFEDGALRLQGGGSLPADAAVALPALVGPSLDGLPQRARGFVLTDVVMQVPGFDRIWAAGDATAFPIKQGGLAAQQADVVARQIAARAGAHVPVGAFQPVLRGELITGGTPQFLRSALGNRSGDVAVAGPGIWWPPTKLASGYLGRYLARTVGEEGSGELVDLESPADPAGDQAEHEHAVALVLAAADADASAGDLEAALRWLSLVEQLNLVIPPEYVARRFEWRRALDPSLTPEAAAARIEPQFAGAERAISDLERRIGWLREIESRTGSEMSEHLARLDRGLERLRALSREAGIDRPERGG